MQVRSRRWKSSATTALQTKILYQLPSIYSSLRVSWIILALLNSASCFKKDEKTERHITILGVSISIVVYLLSGDLSWFCKISSSILFIVIFSKLMSKWRKWRRAKKQLVVRAIKNINEGEEINLCYLGYDENLESKHQMKQHLETKFKFDCKCSVCIGGNSSNIFMFTWVV